MLIYYLPLGCVMTLYREHTYNHIIDVQTVRFISDLTLD
jgi:hypothetical protein